MIKTSKGIYGYYDKENNYICVYIGKDSYINKNASNKRHLYPSNYDAQKINQVLQNNPERYEYKVICEYSDLTDDELNYLEIKEILKYKFLYGKRPKFNFTIGGDGTTGYTHTDETKQKLSELQKGKNIGEKNPNYGNPTNYKHPPEVKDKMSRSRNSSGYLRVSKNQDKKQKQGFVWRYKYFEDGKYKYISSISLVKLEEKVKAKGLKWEKL